MIRQWFARLLDPASYREVERLTAANASLTRDVTALTTEVTAYAQGGAPRGHVLLTLAEHGSLTRKAQVYDHWMATNERPGTILQRAGIDP